jgi:5S rRNA maturation endonuclease (ribonuclease M5)
VAILKRVSNRQGDGAGRALYALKHAVAVRTDIPSPLSLVLDGELSTELRKELAKEFNRHLLLHQGSSKTQHYVVSFGHHLTEREIEKVLDRLENLFSDPYRYHLFVVHQEEHGTAVHIIESADPDGRLRHLSRKEFFELKRAVVRELQPFLNEREREVAKNFSRNIATEDWKHPIELFAPERSFKEYIRRTVKEAAELIGKGCLDGAIELLELRGVKIKEYKAGELSPSGKLLKRDRFYAVFNHPYRGFIAVRLDKKMKATFQLHLNALRELERELGRFEEEFEHVERALRESEPLRGGVPSERKGVPAEGEGAPKEGAGAPSGDKHLIEAEGAPKRGSREFKEEGDRALRERAGVDEDKRKAGETKDSKGGVESQSEVEMPISREILDEIKQLPPEKVLSYLGIPYKQVGNQIMAKAVWRGEKEASVSIQYKNGKWLWHDFGTDEGGDWIDLYRRYTGSDFKEAVSTLMELSNLAYTPNISTREPNLSRKRPKTTSSLSPAETEFEELERIPLRELQEPPKDLREYLELKGFLPYWDSLREIPELYYLRYRRGSKEYSGLATKTTAGTWIIKNKHGTYVSQQPSGISLWRRDPLKVIVVEGFSDAVALSIYPNFRNYSILILNGLGNLDKAVEMLKVLSPSKLYIALDLDEKGLEGRRKLIDEFPEARQIYFYGKDPAEHLLDEFAREYLPPFCEDWIASPYDLYVGLLPRYFEGGYLDEEVLDELSPELYEHYLERKFLDEEAERYTKEIESVEEEYSPQPEENEPEEDYDIGPGL